MKIAVISDSHDHIENLRKALSLAEQEKAEVLVHCGDFCAPFMMEELAKFKGEVHAVFGNIDDRHLTTLNAQKYKINLHGDLADIKIANKKIAAIHFPLLAQALAQTNLYDAVFYGHTHQAKKQFIGKTLTLNPGEIMGRLNKPSLAIYDTNTHDAIIYEIE